MAIEFIDEEPNAPAQPVGQGFEFVDKSPAAPPIELKKPIGVTASFDLRTGLKPEQQKILSKLKAGEKEPEISNALGKALSFIGIPKSSKLVENIFRRDNEAEVERLTLPQKALQEFGAITKETIVETAQLAPFVIGVGTPAQGAGMIRFLGIMKNAFRTGGVTGVSKAIERLARGDDLGEAFTKGAKAGALTGALSGGIESAPNIIKSTSKVVGKAFSRVKPWAVDAAINDVSILTTPQPAAIDVATDLNGAIDDFFRAAKTAYGEGLDAMNISPEAVVKTSGIPDRIRKFGLSPDQVAKKIKTAADSEAVDLSETILKNFVKGQPIPFTEARKVNSILSAIERRVPDTNIGQGFIAKATGIKGGLLDSMSEAVPGIRPLNETFARKASLAGALKEQYGNLNMAEGRILAVGEQVAGKAGKKANVVNRLAEFDSLAGSNFVNQAMKTATAKAFLTASGGRILNGLRVGTGGILGYKVGGIPGALAGSAIAQAATQPQVTEALIKGAVGLQKATAPAVGPSLEAARRVSPIFAKGIQ